MVQHRSSSQCHPLRHARRTPSRGGQALLERRHRVYQRARAERPDRWSRQTRDWTPIGTVWLNPERKGHGAADALPHEAGGGGPMADPVNHAA